jgi:uncharacterized protein YndB with AHSA1/START domain
MRTMVGLVLAVLAGGCLGYDEEPAELDVDTAELLAVEAPREPSWHSIVFEEQAVIAAPIGRIWGLLVDLEHYGDWNPWIVWAEGDAVPGAVVHADVVMNGGDVMEVEHVVLAVDAEQRFCWRDSGPSTLFVYGQRCRWLTPGRDPGTVHFRQQLLLEGVFAPVAKLIYGGALRAGMVAETAALRSTAEAL